MARKGFCRKIHDVSEIECYRKELFEYENRPASFWFKYFRRYYSPGYPHFVEYRVNEMRRVLISHHVQFDVALFTLNDKPGLLYAFKVSDYLSTMDHIETFIKRKWKERVIDRVMVKDMFTIFIHLGDEHYEK